GTVNTPLMKLGDGAGIINFNHTDSSYTFIPNIIGDGQVNVYSGTTIFTGNNTFSGSLNVQGGILALGVDKALDGSSSVIVANGGTLDIGSFENNVDTLNVKNGSTLKINLIGGSTDSGRI